MSNRGMMPFSEPGAPTDLPALPVCPPATPKNTRSGSYPSFNRLSSCRWNAKRYGFPRSPTPSAIGLPSYTTTSDRKQEARAPRAAAERRMNRAIAFSRSAAPLLPLPVLREKVGVRVLVTLRLVPSKAKRRKGLQRHVFSAYSEAAAPANRPTFSICCFSHNSLGRLVVQWP
jgi:hypothetical protein